MLVSELDTPVLVIDLDVMEGNIKRIQDYCDTHGLKFRPHVKTHKVPSIAHKQIAAGAVGITCQKLGEAEVMAAAGIEDILIPYNIVGEQKLERLMRLTRQATVTVAVDSTYTAEGIARKACEEGCTVNVIVELDTGGGRCGVQSPEEALALAKEIVSMPSLLFKGVMTFPTRLESGPFIKKTLELLKDAGIPVSVVSGGGTGTEKFSHRIEGLTEIRLGTYVFYDYSHVRAGNCTLENCALNVLVTVVSRPTPSRAIVDGGSKTFTNDHPIPDHGFHYVKEYPEARIYGQSEEHGHMDVSLCPRKPAVGERLTVIPNHACGTVNLHDELIGVRNGKVEAVWPILARGKIR